MNRPLEELLSVCERAHTEEKSGTRERSILSVTTKSLRKYLQEMNVSAVAGRGTSAASTPSTSPAKPVAPTDSPNAKHEGGPSVPAPAAPSPSPAATPAPAPAGQDPRRLMLTSADAMSRLAYASRVSLVGDRLAPPEKAGSGGSVPRGNAKALVASLELAAVLLNEGFIPCDLVASPPMFDITQSSLGGAHAFFSRLLGGGSGGSSSKGANGATVATAASTTDQPSSEATEAVAKENMREALVDAVLAATKMVLAKDVADKLMFVFITTLQAAAVPRLSRDTVEQLGDRPDELRFSTLALHGPRLVRVVQVLCTILARPTTSPVLVDEVKSVLHLIVKALSKYTETSIRAANTGALGGASPLLAGGTALGQDLVNILNFSCAVCRVAPLSATPSVLPAGQPVSSTATSLQGDASAGLAGEQQSLVTSGGDAAGLLSDAEVASFANYTTLVTVLGFMLHIVANGGFLFRKTDNVIQCIRQSVIPAAVRTSLSSETDVFRLSLNVLLTCCVTFGPYLVNETSTVFRHVYFRVLESRLTSFAHKSMVIEAFQRYIEEPQNLIALFLNYDCNTRSQSIYEEMINYLASMAKVSPVAGDGKGGKAKSSGNEQSPFAGLSSESTVTVTLEYEVPEELQRKAMRTLLLVAESNIQWIERFETDQEDDKKPMSAGGGAGTGEDGTAAAAEEAEDAESAAVTAEDKATDSARNNDNARGDDGAIEASALASTAIYRGVPKHDGFGSSSTNNNDAFAQARRYKDALKKFLYLFNNKGDAEGALGYLKNCILMIEKAVERAEEVNETPAKEADAPHPTPTPAAEAKEGAEENEGRAGAQPPTDVPEAAADTAAPSAEPSVPEPMAKEVEEAARVAQFLVDHEDWVDKVTLGEYFAKSFRKTENRLVFEEWIKLYDFTGLKLDEALRLFLGGFKLLGEAQIVDRTMELFAAQFCRQNPAVFSSADTAFILSFSICMLNTDAHSAHIKNKMKVDGFIRNNKGIDEGNDVDPAILTGVYNRIAKDEIVLRPSKFTSSCRAAAANGTGNAAGATKRSEKLSGGGILESIPVLRHIAPIANVITDKVLLPMDAMGSSLFGGAQRKREEMYQEELRAALREVTDALRSSATLPHSAFVAATSIENALPMWEVTVDIICRLLVSSLLRILEDSERYVSPTVAAQNGGPQNMPADYNAVLAYMRETKSYEYFQVLLRGLGNTVRVCCSFGNVSHTETLLEQTFQMTQLNQTVIMTISAVSGPQVQVVQVIPRSRLELLVCFLNLYVSHGASFGLRGWQVGYAAVSLIDALANGIEGMWKRQAKRLLQRVGGDGGAQGPEMSSGPASINASFATPAATNATMGATTTTTTNTTTTATTAGRGQQPNDLWLGKVSDLPASVTAKSRRRRASILNTIRVIPGSAVDLWLERLFDATQYPAHTQLQMASGLVRVCQKELQHARTFTLTKLFDFVTVCAAFSTRLQWRELWANASAVFVLAGRMKQEIASQALDGLRIVAMTYLMREELLNYSFQKEVLKPFEDVLMSNQDVLVRRRVINIISELIDFRAGHLASGWHVVFTCLSHAAVIPEVVGLAWEVCERITSLHVDHMKDCFSDLIFCLTTFACTNVDEQVPLKGIAYLVACGHWLQYGLEAPPADVREAADVVRWACRFRSADVEARASRTLGKNLTRVALALEPLTQLDPLTKPSSYVAKTNYHLWMSLFEGLIPIIVVHASVRVRAHAVCCIYALLRHYGSVFSVDVQDSLFKGTLRPVLATLLSHVQQTGDNTSDRTDYRMLVYLALRGLVLACNECAHLLELCCDTLSYLSSSLGWSRELVENDLVDVWVRVCCDMLAAVVTSAAATNSGNSGGGGKDEAADKSVSFANTRTSTGASTSVPYVTQNSSFSFLDRSLRGSFTTDPQQPMGSALSWVPQPLPHRKEDNPFFTGVLHEVTHMGAVDVLRFKRTAGWTELHVAAAVTTGTVTLAPPLQIFSLTSLVQKTVLRCLSEGLLAQLAETVTREHRTDRTACLLYTGAIRHAMLGLSFYCAATRDMEGVCALLDTVRPFTHTEGRLTASASSSSSPASANSTSYDTPIELLLTVPYMTVLLEFIFSFPMDFADAGQRILRDRVASFLAELASARGFCVDQQHEVQCVFEQRAAEKGIACKTYKGRGFVDIFRSGRKTIGERGDYCAAGLAPELRCRVFHEWKYLVYVLGVRCAVSLGPSSIIGSCVDAAQLFALLPVLPSALEELAVGGFLRSCWEELDLHCNMPEAATASSCIALLQSKVAGQTEVVASLSANAE